MSFSQQASENRFAQFANAWLESNLPDPTEAITIKLADRQGPIGSNVTHALYRRERHFKAMRDWFGRRGQPFLYLWALEVRRWVHVHYAIYVPDELERQYLRWLCQYFEITASDTQTVLQRARQRNSGLDVHARKISDEVVYEKTGNKGPQGWFDYMGKGVEKLGRYKANWCQSRIIDTAMPIKSVALDNYRHSAARW
jgi:hypothetical protein